MKKLLAVALAAIFIPFSHAAQVATRPIMALYDLDSTSDVSCTSSPVNSSARIVTSGSSTTTAALTTGTVPFNAVTVGDVIYATVGGALTGRVVTAKASGNSITVDSAWDLGVTGVGFTVWKATCAATGTSSWINVAANLNTNVALLIDQLGVGSGGVGVKIEALFGNATDSFTNPVNVWPGEATVSGICGSGTQASGYCVYTTAGAAARPTFSTNNSINPTALRIVMKLTGADDGADATVEKITAYLVEVK